MMLLKGRRTVMTCTVTYSHETGFACRHDCACLSECEAWYQAEILNRQLKHPATLPVQADKERDYSPAAIDEAFAAVNEPPVATAPRPTVRRAMIALLRLLSPWGGQ